MSRWVRKYVPQEQQLKHCICVVGMGLPLGYRDEDILGNSTLKTQKVRNLEIGSGCH